MIGLTSSVWQLYSISLVGVALALMRVVQINLIMSKLILYKLLIHIYIRLKQL